MKTYDVVFKVRVRAENEEEAKAQAIEVLNSPNIMHVDVKVWEIKKLYCNVKRGPCELGSFNFCYRASLPGGGCKYGVENEEKPSST